MDNIFQKACLIQLSSSVWQGTRMIDSNIMRNMNPHHEWLKGRKFLVNPDLLSPIGTAVTQARSFVQRYSLPFPINSVYLIPKESLQTIDENLQKYKDKFFSKVGDFEAMYEVAREEAKIALNDLFNEADYFQKNVGKTSSYVCKHILAVIDCNGDAIGVDPMAHEKSKLDKRFIMNVSGKEFVLYSGLLDLAHQKGLKKISVSPEQFPSKENGNIAICKAVIESVNGEIFVEWGDADAGNVNKMIAKHLLRMAATRAKARALRDFTNIGMTCLDELADLDEVVGNEGKPKGNPKVTNIRTSDSSRPEGQSSTTKGPVTKLEPVQAQLKAEPVKLQQKAEPSTPPPKIDKPVEKKDSEPSNGQGNSHPSEAQLKAIENLSRRRGISQEQLEEMSKAQFGVIYTHISPSDAALFIRNLQQSS